MTAFKVNYEVRIKRADSNQDDELYFEKPEELGIFLRGYIESMVDWYSGEEYTITIHRTKEEGKE